MSTVREPVSGECWGEAMSDDVTVDNGQHEAGVWSASSLFSPAVSAVAAFTLAVVALMGQNVVTIGISTVLGPEFGSGGAMPFYVGFGVAIAVQVGVVLLLARRTLDSAVPWEGVLGRAAVLVAGVALVAAVLVIVGGAVHGDVGF